MSRNAKVFNITHEEMFKGKYEKLKDYLSKYTKPNPYTQIYKT